MYEDIVFVKLINNNVEYNKYEYYTNIFPTKP